VLCVLGCSVSAAIVDGPKPAISIAWPVLGAGRLIGAMPALGGEFHDSIGAGHCNPVNVRYQMVTPKFIRIVRRIANFQLAKGQMRRQRHAPSQALVKQFARLSRS
jgi:hypothetical protein